MKVVSYSFPGSTLVVADKVGLYHLRILLPTTYPMSAPDIIFMTPNGRFELGKKVSSQFLEQEELRLMVDMYRRLNFFPRWIMATSMGRTNRYVPSPTLHPNSTTLLTPTYRHTELR